MTAKQNTPKGYQQLSAELAEILAWFESDEVNLDEAIAKYEQAMELIIKLENHLKTAKNQVRKVTTKFEK